jgi:hypothetical protein
MTTNSYFRQLSDILELKIMEKSVFATVAFYLILKSRENRSIEYG